MAFRGLVLSGARARLTLDTVKVALAMNVSFSEEITFSSQMVRIVTNTIKNRDGVVIFPTLENILTRGEMTATVEDTPTGSIIANIEGVKATRYSNNIGARGIVMKDVEYVAIRIRNESEIV